jgi:hypothetical protein
MSFLGTRKYSPELPHVFEEKVAEYFIPENEPWLITDLCIHLGIHRETLLEYGKVPQFADTVKAAKQVIENYSAKQLFHKQNVTGVIFNLKNNFNWVDKQEINSNNTNTNINTDDNQLLEKLKEKYLKEKE